MLIGPLPGPAAIRAGGRNHRENAMEFQAILVETDGPLGLLTLNKPDRHNALDEHLIGEITEGLRQLEAEPQVRVVVLSATGKSFCAGTDLQWQQRAARFSPSQNLQEARNLGDMLQTLNTLTKPVIARVQGPAYGGGVGLVAACDIALATYDALFALTDVKLGLLPALAAPYFQAAVGPRHARRYLLTGERFSAAEAYRLGLVHELVPDEEALDDAVGEIVDKLLRNGPAALGACKEMLAALDGHPLDGDLVLESAARATQVRLSSEGQEGIAAFLEKRKPAWAQTLDEPA